MKDNRAFVDTNIFVYASLEEKQQGDKRDKSIALLQSLSDKVVYINTQVLHEIYSVMLRHGIDEKEIQDKLSVIIRETKLSVIRLKTVKRCWDMRQKYKYSYWDCLILASALENDCAVVYSEDMQHNQIIGQSLRIINPFIQK
ncbi:MAG: PIN domain-containing protein [Deltaproteobacteria bacterium]|nr:PIN domain-containing protein [Deltaproteobacteria bacterium]